MTVTNENSKKEDSGYVFWLQLMMEARELGLTVADIRQFINREKKE